MASPVSLKYYKETIPYDDLKLKCLIKKEKISEHSNRKKTPKKWD